MDQGCLWVEYHDNNITNVCYCFKTYSIYHVCKYDKNTSVCSLVERKLSIDLTNITTTLANELPTNYSGMCQVFYTYVFLPVLLQMPFKMLKERYCVDETNYDCIYNEIAY